jgi:predicted HAD superfamily phosphohydrolase YqeG
VKKKFFKNVILFGSGRWAKIYLETLIRKKVNIVVITLNKGLINFFLNHNFDNYQIINKLDKMNIDKKSYIIVSNSTNKRLNLIKKIIKFKKDILLEKPLSNDPNDFFKHNLNKKNIYLSLQFTFANYFIQIKKK